MNQHPKIAVVILNWNGKNWLNKFLPSVVSYCPTHTQIWVADNASTDGSVDLIENEFPTVFIHKLDKNYGFTGGYNRALNHIKAEYYVLLNSDVEVTEGWLDPMLELLEKNPSIAACQPKIKSYAHKDEFEYAGAAGGFIDQWGYPFCRGRLFNSYEKDEGQYNDVKEIFWASGAALFIRSSVYNECGGLDEDFFAHMEEIDLCWRIKNRGYQIFYHPDSVVYHVGGGTLSMGSPKKVYLNFRNNLQLLTKNVRGSILIPVIFFRMILDGIAAISFLKQPKGWQSFMSVFRAHINFYMMLGSLIKKRKKITQHHVSCIYKGSVVWMYFVKKIRSFSNLPNRFTS
jgi:GT2 family glycosyltransferase